MKQHAKLTAKSKEKSSEGEEKVQRMQSTLSTGGNAVLDLIVLAMARGPVCSREGRGSRSSSSPEIYNIALDSCEKAGGVRQYVWGRTQSRAE